MADSSIFKTEVEPYIRQRLTEIYSCPFKPTAVSVQLTTGGDHEFDAVSEDGTIIVGVKSNSGKTKSGRQASASVLACIAELYYLSLIRAQHRILVVTDEDMFKILERKITSGRQLAPGIQIEYVALSKDLIAKTLEFKPVAQAEVSPLPLNDQIV
jgi:hypothetical protein